MAFILQSIVVFCSLALTDFCWGYYINKVKDGNALHSAKWAVLLFLTGSVGVVSYVHNPWLIIPAAFGCFAGTYFSVWKQSKTKKIEKTKRDERAVESITIVVQRGW